MRRRQVFASNNQTIQPKLVERKVVDKKTVISPKKNNKEKVCSSCNRSFKPAGYASHKRVCV